ncbi:Branchpoint-bridging protein [Tetrabaena socialis]|uniref:Branchpoint-bridging protein n=1 Tax=Tetrabaena socialis TaxID=47790 RepID=A0A2J8A8I7_9CHLO|nr:Branchpoint-bridging protein [Tetrabaena socialis]|eukprot:PNH08821.1 Branchpoint-bridging protein [Tetrabaena socialis]
MEVEAVKEAADDLLAEVQENNVAETDTLQVTKSSEGALEAVEAAEVERAEAGTVEAEVATANGQEGSEIRIPAARAESHPPLAALPDGGPPAGTPPEGLGAVVANAVGCGAPVGVGAAAGDDGQEPKRRRRGWGPPVLDAVPGGGGGGGDGPARVASASTPAPLTEGQPAGTEGDSTEADRKRKRRSRWEENEGATASTALAVVPSALGGGAVAVFPREVMLSGGIKVSLPSTITGEASNSHLEPRNNELDIPSEGDPRRSPSPEPVYDRNGIRQNTREIRHRERLLDLRNRVVEELMREDPSFKPPGDYRPKKYWRKVYIPQDAFPSYNFIGLIIGPRGNTQKRMQKETNTKIAIRGRGSVKEGASRDPKYDYGEDEELHVLITGERQDDELGGAPPPEMMGDMSALEARDGSGRAGGGRSRRPGDDLPDDHKIYIAGLPPIFDDAMLRSMFEPFGNVLYATVATDGAGNSRGFGFVHMPDAATARAARDGMDGRPIEGRPLTVRLRSERNEPRQRGGGPPSSNLDGVDDACKLYLGQLPPSASEQLLRSLFEPFGGILELRLIRDRETGGLKGFGFLTMSSPAAANAVMRSMHGYRLEGKTIVVKQAGAPPGSGRDDREQQFRGPKPEGLGRMMGPSMGAHPPPPDHYPPPGPAPPPGGPRPPPASTTAARVGPERRQGARSEDAAALHGAAAEAALQGAAHGEAAEGPSLQQLWQQHRM